MIRTQRLGRAGGAGALLSHHNRMPNMTSRVGRQHSSSFLPPLLQSPTSVSHWLNPARNQQTKESRKRRKWLFFCFSAPHMGTTTLGPRSAALGLPSSQQAHACSSHRPATHTEWPRKSQTFSSQVAGFHLIFSLWTHLMVKFSTEAIPFQSY